MAIRKENSKQGVVNSKRGIALLVTLIFMSVMLVFGLTLASLSYKQSVLASSAIESQYAFYAADAALECVLYADQRQQAFTYSTHSKTNPPNATVCNSVAATITSYAYTGTQLTLVERISLDGGIHCADMTIYKKAKPDASGYTTYLFAQGYNTSCAIVADPQNARVASRGIDARY
ncbi:MAG: pilus assembly PilX N-terminal domain-containing protein [bacterium]|nr:pilus assembly PilX N-terminal domain-containing protein [bacterium]